MTGGLVLPGWDRCFPGSFGPACASPAAAVGIQWLVGDRRAEGVVGVDASLDLGGDGGDVAFGPEMGVSRSFTPIRPFYGSLAV